MTVIAERDKMPLILPAQDGGARFWDALASFLDGGIKRLTLTRSIDK